MGRGGGRGADEARDEPGPPPGFSGIWVRTLADGFRLEVEYADGKSTGRVRIWDRETWPFRGADALPRMTTRRLMAAVAAAGLVLGGVAHARKLSEDREFGPAIFALEIFGVAATFAIIGVARSVLHFVRRCDDGRPRSRNSGPPAS